MVKPVHFATFRADHPFAALTPGGEGRCCLPLESIKVEQRRAESGRGRDPDPRTTSAAARGSSLVGSPRRRDNPPGVSPGRYGPGTDPPG